MISDGCGDNQILATNYYCGKTQQYQSFPISLFHSTYPARTAVGVDLQNWNNSYTSLDLWTNYFYMTNHLNITCSGASGTAIASGKKTFYYCLNVDNQGNALKSIATYAKELGKSAGVASTVEFFETTPAIFGANNPDRLQYSDISKQMILESKLDVILGCGNPLYNDNGALVSTPNYSNIGGKAFWEDIVSESTTFRTASLSGWTTVQDIDGDNVPDPWHLIQDSIEFAEAANGNVPKRLLGIAKAKTNLQLERTLTDGQLVYADPPVKNVPDLSIMSKAALNVLNQNPNGFFVMIEGGAVDDACHKNYKGRMIEEEIDFNKAVDTVIAWIGRNGGWEDNLLIVTADHETAFLTGPGLSEDSLILKHYEIIDKGPGNVPDMEFHGTWHSNQLVPIFAKGAGSEIFNSLADESDIIRGRYLNNSEIGQAMFMLWDGVPGQLVNNKPVVIKKIDDVVVTVGRDTTFSIPKDFIVDNEDTEFYYEFTTRPKWCVVDNENLSISGTPDKVANTITKIIVSDGKLSGASLSVEATFLIKSVLPDTSTSKNEILSRNIKLYPNPAKLKINIETDEILGNVEILDVNSRILISEKSGKKVSSIDISALPKGTYFIRYYNSKNKVVNTKKFLIN